MLKKMLATTALSALLVAPALAQDTVQPDEPADAPAMMDDAPETPTQDSDPLDAPMEEPEADMPEFGEPEAADPAPEADPLQGETTGGLDTAPATDPIFAEDVIGADLVDFDGETIATVDDAVLDANGNVESLLVDVGGFLGFGARTVAISMDDVTMETDLDGNVVLRTALTGDDLENLPEYEEEPEVEM